MADDRSLLDRLNALNPTAVSLDKDKDPKLAFVATAEPASKEDVLSARLRTLRNASVSASPRQDNNTGIQPRQPDTASGSSSSNTPLSRAPPPPGDGDGDGDDDIDPLFHGDDSTLDEFLESLGLEDDDDVSLDRPPPLRFDPRDESEKVAALLEELGKPAADPSERDDKEDDDDSDGEAMSAQIRQLLSRALDEAELDRSLCVPDRDQDSNPHPGSPPKGEAGLPNPSPPGQQPEEPPKTSSETDNHLSLPTVPSALVDPTPPPLDFESSIAARMAALSGVSYGTASSSDTFGLPSAPSFEPDSRAGPSASSFAGRLRGGYTDEDQKTWCVVCLEDATVKCVGCDGDVYCARCWRDMHVGPRAGYDERGHRWVRFERG